VNLLELCPPAIDTVKGLKFNMPLTVGIPRITLLKPDPVSFFPLTHVVGHAQFWVALELEDSNCSCTFVDLPPLVRFAVAFRHIDWDVHRATLALAVRPLGFHTKTRVLLPLDLFCLNKPLLVLVGTLTFPKHDDLFAPVFFHSQAHFFPYTPLPFLAIKTRIGENLHL